jgi:hypothetical protein
VVPLRRVAHAIRGPAGIVLLAGSLAVALRLPFVHDPPYADEGGLLVVAAHWHPGGPYLYGSFFVDRPPLLLAFFRMGDLLGGLVALRVLGLGLVFLSVLLAGRAGALLGGRRGAVAAAVVCAALLADPRLGTREIDAEIVGVPLVMLAAVLALEAVRRHPPASRLALLLAAGAAGSSALLVKQNLADGLLFAAVVVGASGARRIGPLALGAAVPLVAAAVWSTRGAGVHSLWYALYGFRLAAGSALFNGMSVTQDARLNGLFLAAVLSGMVLTLVVAVVLLSRRPLEAVTVALVAMLAAEVMGAAGGGSHWSHYLVALVPGSALLAARAVVGLRRAWVVGSVVAVTVVATGTDVAGAAADPTPPTRTEVGALSAWLTRHEHPGDSAVVLYGDASLFSDTALRPAYPYLWTLPQRVLDPHLVRLAQTLDRPGRPRFVVVRMSLDPWGQDPRGRVRRALAEHYRPAAHVDGDLVYVVRGPSGQKAP